MCQAAVEPGQHGMRRRRVAMSRNNSTVLRKNLASAKIVKVEFNANLDLLGHSPFYNI